MSKPGLYANIHAKQERIDNGSGETMRNVGDKGAPLKGVFRDIAASEMQKKKEQSNNA